MIYVLLRRKQRAKKGVSNQEIKFERYKECLKNKNTILNHNKVSEVSCIIYSRKR